MIHHVSMGYVMIPQEDITAVVHLGIRGRTATVVSKGHTVVLNLVIWIKTATVKQLLQWLVHFIL